MARISGRILYVVAFLALAIGYYEFLGPAPTPSERRDAVGWWRPMGLAREHQSDWMAPLQRIAADFEQARHEGRSEPRGLIPFSIFALPPIAMTVLGFALSRGAIWRVAVLSLGLTLGAFAYYGWLDAETWQDFSWRWPATLAATAGYVSLFLLAPALVRAARRRSVAVQALAAVAAFASIYFLSTEVTGTNPHLEWNLSPWPMLTLYGFLLVGLVVGVVHLAVGVALLVRGAHPSARRALAAAALAAALAASLAWVPFSRIGPLQVAALALPAAALALRVGRGSEVESGDGRWFVVAGLLLLLAIKVGQWQGEYFLALSRDEVSPRVIDALERYRVDNGAYPDELVELTPRYLAAIPQPRVGWFDSEDAAFLYTNLGDSYLLEFSGVVWVQCAYSPAYREETDEIGESGAASQGSEEQEALAAAWSCERKPPQLW